MSYTIFYATFYLWGGSYGSNSTMDTLIICTGVLMCGVFGMSWFYEGLLGGNSIGGSTLGGIWHGVTVLNIYANYFMAYN